MQKFRRRALFCARSSLIKYLLMTKLAILLITLFSFQTFAKSYGQRNISLKLENVQLKKVFKAIESQGFFRFVYKDDILPRETLVSISVKDATLDEVLARILSGTTLRYQKLSDNLVVITRENRAAAAESAVPATAPP